MALRKAAPNDRPPVRASTNGDYAIQTVGRNSFISLRCGDLPAVGGNGPQQILPTLEYDSEASTLLSQLGCIRWLSDHCTTAWIETKFWSPRRHGFSFIFLCCCRMMDDSWGCEQDLFAVSPFGGSQTLNELVEGLTSKKATVEQLLSREGNIQDRNAARERLVMSLGGKAPKGKALNYKILKKERKKKKEDDAKKAAEMKALLRVNSAKKIK
ncbi:unnamed protein product [Haemonchus placei]|uniref:Uncharacterized protein n=1 Tax=Haemonchus placei TaxID=6290 RepID=A0A3P7XPQ9_HAEPC|nr:unnamed protein product [Haemonchus placei]